LLVAAVFFLLVFSNALPRFSFGFLMSFAYVLFFRISVFFFSQVLVPCNTGDHWVLCQVFLKEGKVKMYDSFCPRTGENYRLKDIAGLLYLLPSILKHANYYEHMKMSPHTSPFTAENIEPTIIPQQDDG